MMCDRCGKPIAPGEESETRGKDSGSGSGGTVTLHAELCERPLTQTYPTPRTPVTGSRR